MWFTGRDVVEFLNQHPYDWAVVSAERAKLSPRTNARRSAALALEALEAGLVVVAVDGTYKGSTERSYILVGDGAQDVAGRLGRQYQQESVLGQSGLWYLGTDRVDYDGFEKATWRLLRPDENPDFQSRLLGFDKARIVYDNGPLPEALCPAGQPVLAADCECLSCRLDANEDAPHSLACQCSSCCRD
jgi:hypothetical protein